MKNKKGKKSESAAKEVELVVTQEDYEAGLKRGWTDDDMLKPGRYKFKRGGFLARHPELKIKGEEARLIGNPSPNSKYERSKSSGMGRVF